jgi:hypothetical protein
MTDAPTIYWALDPWALHMVRWFVCDSCNELMAMPAGSGGTGYGRTSDGRFHCYGCCARQEADYMRRTGKADLYLVRDTRKARLAPYAHSGWEVTDWPGQFRRPVTRIEHGAHNSARTRTDVWFRFEGQAWHGVQYGENTQIVHCRRIKG